MSWFLTHASCVVHGFENVWYSMREREEEEEALGQDRVDTTFKLNVKGTTNFGVLSLIGRITSEAGPNTGQSLLHVQLLLHRYCKIILFTEYSLYWISI